MTDVTAPRRHTRVGAVVLVGLIALTAVVLSSRASNSPNRARSGRPAVVPDISAPDRARLRGNGDILSTASRPSAATLTRDRAVAVAREIGPGFRRATVRSASFALLADRALGPTRAVWIVIFSDMPTTDLGPPGDDHHPATETGWVALDAVTGTFLIYRTL